MMECIHIDCNAGPHCQVAGKCIRLRLCRCWLCERKLPSRQIADGWLIGCLIQDPFNCVQACMIVMLGPTWRWLAAPSGPAYGQQLLAAARCDYLLLMFAPQIQS